MRSALRIGLGLLVAAALSLPTAALAEDLAPTCGTSSATKLWPVNHKFKTVALPTATDPEGGALTASAPTVMQDEPVDELGDGAFAPDAQIKNGSLQLRVERSGTGDGRFYHVSVTFTDLGGNQVTCERLYVVPHSQAGGKGKGKAPAKQAVDQGPLYDSFATS